MNFQQREAEGKAVGGLMSKSRDQHEEIQRLKREVKKEAWKSIILFAAMLAGIILYNLWGSSLTN